MRGQPSEKSNILPDDVYRLGNVTFADPRGAVAVLGPTAPSFVNDGRTIYRPGRAIAHQGFGGSFFG